jgi:hypothetical protein
MIKITGPSNGYLHVGDPAKDSRSEIQKTPFFEVEAATLGEALQAYCQRTGSSIRPYDGSDPQLPFRDGELKYFWFDAKSRWGETLADVHVKRNGVEICPKQDLSFALIDGDMVSIGMLAC